MARFLFASDLHGREARYVELLAAVEREPPRALLLGGDLLPQRDAGGDFLLDWLAPRLAGLRQRLGVHYPRLLVIFGNDDPRAAEDALGELEGRGLLEHVHGRCVAVDEVPVYGYACVPPTPFRLKDWERYDVSRFVEPGAISPEEGFRTRPPPEAEVRFGTIADDLAALVGSAELSEAVFLLHSPPYDTALDRAALDGRSIDHAPLDPHIGSVAIRRFLEARQPRLALHGHVHESARLTGAWHDRIGRTVCLSAAHDGPELALVEVDPRAPEGARRRLL